MACSVPTILSEESVSSDIKNIPDRAEIWFEISAPPAPPSQLSYDEYTDCTLSVGRTDGEGEDWPPALICRG